MKTTKKKKPAKPQYVTRTILRQEFSRLDTKIDNKDDSAVVAMDDDTDSNFNRLRSEMREGFEFLGNKIDQFVKAIVDIFERQAAQTIAATKRVDNREERITVLEEKTG